MSKQQLRTESKNGELYFEVDSGLLFQLGERLVARRSIALAELIKNSYDADATQVVIRFKDVTRPNGAIIVEDNGTGMTLDQIQQSWMRIATNEKMQEQISPIFCRPRTGAKGVGRFAARRLSKKLILNTVALTKSGSKEKTIVEFDWDKNYSPGQNLTIIPAIYKTTTVVDETPTGVSLELMSARDVWNEDDITELQQDILSLVSPFPVAYPQRHKPQKGCERDPGFSITWDSPEFPAYEGAQSDQTLSAAWSVLTAEVGSNGGAHYHLSIRSPHERLNYSPKEPHFDKLIGARFRIHFFVYRSEYFEDLGLSVREFQTMGREQGGVRIYLDGFRVFPYGDPTDDWLDLNNVRAGRTRRLIEPPAEVQKLEATVPGRPFLLIPGNNQLFGAVEISQAGHVGIEINIGRERLVENDGFKQLKKFVQLGIYWMTIHYARVKAEEDAAKKKKRARIFDILAETQRKIQSIKGISSDAQREISQMLEYAKEQAQAEEEEHISELSMLRVLSAAGATIEILNHQLRALIDSIRSIHTDLKEQIAPQVSQKANKSFTDILTRIQDWKEMVSRQASQVGLLLDPAARMRRLRLPLKKVVDNVTQPLSLYMRDYGIILENTVPQNFKTPAMFEAELHAILLHVFTNALKAVRAEKVRKIKVAATHTKEGVHILMFDTGKGIESGERRDQVFKPFVTDSDPDPILGVGTGLGLTVVRDLLATYDGSARFIDPDEPWRTCIDIFVPEES